MKFNGFKCLTEEQLDTLFKTGSVETKDGIIEHSDGDVYVTPEDEEQRAKDRISIAFAESERARVEKEGAIVHEDDIKQPLAKTEKIKAVLYDMYSDDININRGDIDGLQGATYSSFTFDPTGAKGLIFYARVANVVYIKGYIDFTHIKQGLGNEISCSPLGKNQHSTEVNNAYIVNGVTCHVIKNSDTEYLFGVPAFFTFNTTNGTFSFKNAETNRYVYRVELVEE